MAFKRISVAVAAIMGLTLQAAAQMVTPAPQTVSSSKDVDPLTRAVALYATFQSDVSDVKSKQFGSIGEIETSVTTLGGHNAKQLTGGWLAYSGLVASQNDEFRAAVLDIDSYYGRDVFLNGMKNDLRYAGTLSGGDAALQQALSAVRADSDRLLSAGAYVKEQAYSLQAVGWAKRKVGSKKSSMEASLMASRKSGIPTNPYMLSAVQSPNMTVALSQAGQDGAPSVWESVSSAASTIRLPDAITSIGEARQVAKDKKYIANRITTLAAYRILGIGTESSESLAKTMNEAQTVGCIDTANSNVRQCVVATHRYDEVPFCIGQHALSEIGECIGRVTQ